MGAAPAGAHDPRSARARRLLPETGLLARALGGASPRCFARARGPAATAYPDAYGDMSGRVGRPHLLSWLAVVAGLDLARGSVAQGPLPRALRVGAGLDAARRASMVLNAGA